MPRTNPTQRPAVWAVDPDHAPLYWFPRDCPRVTAWPRTLDEQHDFQLAFSTEARRFHAIEVDWLERMRSSTLYRYDFVASEFEPWPEAEGQWIAFERVEPVAVSLVGDLLQLHEAAGIELRPLNSLWPIAELAQDDRWGFSIVRMVNAAT